MATVHGLNAILYLGATNAAPVTEIHNISLTTDTDFAEDSSMGDTWKTYLAGLSDFQLDFDKWFDDATGGGSLLQAVINRTVQKFYFYPSRLTSTIYVYGTAYVGGGGFEAGMDGAIDQSYSLRSISQPTVIHP